MEEAMKMVNLGLPPKHGSGISLPSPGNQGEGSVRAGPWHRRSASDPLGLLKKPDFMKRGSGNPRGLMYPSLIDAPFANMDLVDENIKNIESTNPKSDVGETSDGGGASNPQPWETDTLQYQWGHSIDPNMEPKKIKRILANRLSAQRSRVRKLQYMHELENGVAVLQAEISRMAPQVTYYQHQRLKLKMDNCVLKQKIAAVSAQQTFKEAEYELLMKERERLTLLYMLQQQQKQEVGLRGTESIHEHASNARRGR